MISRIGFVLLLLIMSFVARAQEGAVGACPACSNETKKSPLEIRFWSVTDSEVQSAHCLNLQPPTEAEMTDYLKNVAVTKPNETEDASVDGISFQNESSELIQLFRNLHASKKELQLKSQCKEVLCAMNEIYGKPQGTQLLYLYARYGYAATTLTQGPKDNIPWTSAELSELISDLQSLPPKFFPMQKYQALLLHSTIGASFGCDGKEIANDAIQILAPWFCQSKEKRIISFIHEVGHNVARENDFYTDSQWLKASGWKILGENPNGTLRTDGADVKSPASIYASKDIYEDFAESFSSYRLSPEHLKSISPERYNYMKEVVFRGVEFTSDSCQETFQFEKEKIAEIKRAHMALEKKAVADEARDHKLIEDLSRQQPLLNSDQISEILGQCVNSYLRESIVGSKGAADSCLSKQIQRQVFTAAGGDADAPASELAAISVSERQRDEVRSAAKNYLSEKLYQLYRQDDAVAKSRTNQQCNDSAKYFQRRLPDDAFRATVDMNVLQQVVAKACRLRIQAFGTKWIGQYNNPFAKNTFEKVFNF